MAKRNSQSSQADDLGFIPEDAESDANPDTKTSNPRAARQATARSSAPPSGQMARAPSKLRITRNTTVGSMRGGPNLRGRDGNARGGQKGRAGPGNRGDGGPKRRERDRESGDAPLITSVAETDPSSTLSDGMVHHLLRLQRKEWDRVPYEPKYAQGSFAANELIHAGRELFKGESPPVKLWGPLEQRIGVVNMFGAEAQLQVRRVQDGDAEPFGQEVLDEEEEIEGSKDAKKEPTVQ